MNQMLKTTIRTFKTAIVILIYFQLQACVMEGPILSVHIINLSKDKVYIQPMYDTCNTCETQQDVRKFCSGDSSVFDEKLSSNDSTIVAFKDYGYVKVLVVNIDSLKDYCSKGNAENLTNKKWLKIMLNDKINQKTRSCTFVIN